MARLVYSVDDELVDVELRQRMLTSIGRDPRSTIVLDHPTVSPRHCEVRYSGGLWMVIHLGGTVPTLLNGEPIEDDSALVEGDVLTVGDFIIGYESDEGARVARAPRARSQVARARGLTRRASAPKPGGRARPPRPRRSSPASSPASTPAPSPAPASEPPRAAPPAARASADARVPRRATRRRPRGGMPAPVAGIVLGAVVLLGGFILVFALTRPSGDEDRSVVGDEPLGSGTRAGSVISLGGDGAASRPRGRVDSRDSGSELEAWTALDNEKIRPAVQAGRLGDALEALGSFRTDDAVVLPLIATRRAEIEAAVESEITRLTESTRTLVAADRGRRARDLLGDASKRLPETVRARLLALAETTRVRATGSTSTPATAIDDAIAHLRAGRLDAARESTRLLAGVELDETHTRLVRGLELADRARSLIEETFRRRVRAELEPPMSILLETPSEATRKRYSKGDRLRTRVAEWEYPVLQVSTANDERFTLRVLALPTETLVALVIAESRVATPDDPLAEEDAQRGLGLLLLASEGPTRAGPSLEAGGLLPAFEDIVDRAAWAETRADALHERVRAASVAASDARAWSVLADELLLVAREIEGLDAFPPAKRTALRENLRQVEARRIPLADIFLASEASQDARGQLRLVWEFDRDEELRAFAPVDRGRPTLGKGKLILTDEVRLLDGDPFANRLAVEVLANVTDPKGPNLNVALWTRAGDRLTFRDGETTSDLSRMRWEPREPRDWALFGCGYRAVVCVSFERPFEAIYRVGDAEAVPFPANVILAGGHGLTLHRDPSECLYAESITASSAKWSTRVAWTPEDLTWEVNGRPIVASFARLLEPRPRKGSLSFVTNGRRVEIERLVVEAEPDPEWLATRRLEFADRALRTRAPSLLD